MVDETGLVERVARDAANATLSHLGKRIGWEKLHEEEREVYRTVARAAIEAMPALEALQQEVAMYRAMGRRIRPHASGSPRPISERGQLDD